MQHKNDEQTHFGYKTVNKSHKRELVADVFDSVATKYDLMNDLMSLGIHRLWKANTISNSGVRKGQKVLDVGGGTGDLSQKFSKIVGVEGKVILSDINQSMLKEGRKKLRDLGFINNISYVQADAEHLPFPDNYFDCVSISFCLRNVTNKEAALRSIYRVLKPGGRILILEFSKPNSQLISKLYDTYSFNVLPILGKIITGDSESYKYLAESIRMHPSQEELKEMMHQAGFDEVKYYNYTDGIVALHKGFKF